MYDYQPTAGTVYIVEAEPDAPDPIEIRRRDIFSSMKHFQKKKLS